MSEKSKKKKIITAIVGGATAGILYTSDIEAKNEEENEKEKKIKSQSNPKILLPKPPNSNRQSNRYKYTIIQQQDTIYVDSNGEEQTTSKIDLSDIKTIEIVQIGFYENKIGEIQAVKMPKTIQKVPDQLPSEITSTKQMFQSASSFDQDISGWDVSNVTDMSDMFAYATSFNQNISVWRVEKVKIMRGMFFNAHAFDQNISSWNVNKVTDMHGMFAGARKFNQDISGWDVSKVIIHDNFAINSWISNSIDKLPNFNF